MNLSRRALLFFVCVMGAATGATQTKEVPLKVLLARLEKKYRVGFTYADQYVSPVQVVPPPETFSLAEALNYLQSLTDLAFEQISPRQIIISKPEKFYRACGTVVSLATAEKLPGVLVWADDHHTVTDANGYFELTRLPDGAQVFFRLLGHKTISQPLSFFAGSTCPTVSLAEEVVVINELIIREYLTEGIDKKADGSFSIKPQSLGILPGLTEPDVLQAVQALPGIRSFNENIADINIRGGTNDQNLILWDGIKMYQTGHFFGLISAFNPYLTDKIAFTKNGTAAEWGDGVSGIIDIRTDDRPVSRPTGSLGVNLLHADAIGKLAVGKNGSLQVSGRHSLPGLQTPTYRRFFERSFGAARVTNAAMRIDTVLNKTERFDFYDVSLKYQHNFSATNKLRVSLLNMKNKIQYAEDVLIGNHLETRTSFLEQQNFGSSAAYSHLWNTRFRSTVQGYVSRYQLAAVNHDIPNNQRLNQQNTVLDMGVKLDSRLSLGDNRELFFGYQFYEVGIRNLEDINNPAFRRDSREVLRNHAAFAEGSFFSPNGRTSIRGGLRASYFPALKQTLIEPRLAISHNVVKQWHIELLAERKSQVTSQVIDLQNDFLGIEKRRWVLSNNQDIPIMQSSQVSAGLHYKQNNALVSLEGFYKVVDGIITSGQAFQNQFQYVRSAGGYRIHGLDFLFSRKTGPFNTWFTYSISNNQFQFEGLIPPVFRNNLDIRHLAAMGVSLEKNRWSWSAGLNYHSGRPFTRPAVPAEVINNRIVFQSPNLTTLPHFLRLDVACRYDFSIGSVRMQTGLSVWNLLNRANKIDIHYFVSDQGTIDYRSRQALRATVNGMLRAYF